MEKKLRKVIIKEGSMTHFTTPPFPNALKGIRKVSHYPEIFEILKQVKENIPLLDMTNKYHLMQNFSKIYE